MMSVAIIPPKLTSGPFDYTNPVHRFMYGSAVNYVARGTYTSYDIPFILWGNADLRNIPLCVPGRPAGAPSVDEDRMYRGEYDTAAGRAPATIGI